MADKATKMTKRDWFELLKTAVEQDAIIEEKDEVIKFLDNEIRILDHKAEQAKERAEKTKKKGDDLRNTVQAALGYDWLNIDEVTAIIGDPEVTKAKVTARLNQLAEVGIAEKEKLKGKDGRKVMHYKLAETDLSVDEEPIDESMPELPHEEIMPEPVEEQQ